MPKPETSNPNAGPSFQAPRYRPNWPAALLCFAFGAFLLVAFLWYDPGQSTFRGTTTVGKNPAGVIGANSVWALFYSIGVSAWLIPPFLFWLLYLSVRNSKHVTGTRAVAMLIACVSFAGGLAMFSEPKWGSDYFPHGYGGLVGVTLYYRLLADALGPFGSGLIFGTIYVGSLLFIFTRDIGSEFEKLFSGWHAWRAERAKRKAEERDLLLKAKEARAKQKTAAASVAANSAAQPAGPVGPSGKKTFVPKSAEDPLAKGPVARAPESESPAPAPRPVVPPPEKPAPKPVARAPESATATDPKQLAVAAGKVELNIVRPEEPKKAAKISLPQSDDATYQFPPLSLLREQAKPAAGNSEEEHRQNAENLLRILREFGVEVTLGEIHVGPVITRYEVVPAPGVRVEKIAGLDKNIALGMRAQSVRILAPIPGKAAVGVEVPNQHPTPVGMRELLESEDWAGVKSEIPIALGKDVSGKPLVSDLSKMPHLLIAGATGSGKSVCINSIVASILYSKSPKDLRLIMVDPKVVELKIFNSLPHMLIPVVTEPKKVPGALKWLLSEMEQRYQIFAKCNVRNIVGFNSRKKAGAEPVPAPDAQGALAGVDPLEADEIEIPERLPYIVAIIDELADLMMVAPAEIETSIARLAQLARAAGIHLIIATQRPSVNVITGVIKANLPSRIAFQVASQVDSRTILDTKGADTLIGRGDMLFSPPGTSRLVRAQGAFVSDEEVQEMVEFLKRNGPPQYAQSVQQQIDRAASEDDEDGDGGGDDEDLGDDEELYQQALDVLKSTKRASTSMLQRRLRIGYNRAARIMEIMEEKGIVGPENGSSPREILVDLDSL
ncbi:MAG: cell division protein FtsK [Opitutia bacterium Tous-C1TDCM]|nr:MAG: cell division protein FtsK [Opitutae bacterium Tous-C1TDCM]